MSNSTSNFNERVYAMSDEDLLGGDDFEVTTPRILHQSETVAVVKAALEGEFATKGTVAIGSPTAPGETYAQSEMESLKQAIDAILVALRNTGIVTTDVIEL